MKKLISMITMISLACGVFAAETGFFGSGTAGATVVIPAASGTLSAEDVLLSVETAATCTVKIASVSVVSAAASTGTDIVLYTDSTNTIRGITLTTDDYLIIGEQLCDISTLTPADANSTTATVAAAASVSANENIWIVDTDNDISLYAQTTWDNYPIPFLFGGRNKAPAAIVAPSGAGATMISGKAVRK